jgi:hypothetical protein
VAIVLLSIALAAAVAALAYFLIRLDAANRLIDDQERQIKDQHELIDKKETFGAEMKGLLDTAHRFDGVLLTSIVPWERYEAAAERAWDDRRNPESLDRDTDDVRAATKELEDILSAAKEEASTNTTRSKYESVIDKLSHGFATSVLEDADALCESDVLACVISDDPYTVHFDAADNKVAYMTDWLRTGVAYHEFAHVLQFTNPEPTEVALKSFKGDDETMADCFALTYLPGWKLDHRIWVNSYTYWDVSIGYGHTCNSAQKKVIRDWYGQLGFQARPITQ